ncbi:MAG: oligosaccharide flippase family protein [Bacteroidia bacterium]|nr:oligosaccharide flippase family protein [Bacteroidia bacterium]
MRPDIKKIILHPFFANSFWAILGSFVSKGINFVSIAWIARILGPEMFGEYNVIQTTVGMFGTVSGLGLGLAATKLIAEFRDRDILKVGRIISTLYLLSFIISFIVAVVFFSTAGLVSNNLLNNDNLTLFLQITSVIVIFDAIAGIQNGVLTGFEAFKEMTYIGVVVGIISAPLLVIGAFYYGLTGLTVMLLLSRLINVIANKIYLDKKFKIHKIKVKPQINKEVVKDIFDIGTPSFLAGLSTNAFNWISTSVFVNQPFGYQALGTFNTANQLRTIVTLLPDSAGKVTMPQLANAYGNQEMKRFKKTVIVTFFWNLILSLLPAVVLFFFGGYFQQFFGEKFNLSNHLILVVLVTGILIALNNAVGYILICSNLIWYDFILRIFWGIALILIILFYGRYNGAIGYAISILWASIVHMIAQAFIILIKFKYKSHK